MSGILESAELNLKECQRIDPDGLGIPLFYGEVKINA